MTSKKNRNPQSLGGKARAESLSPEERKDIARQAALVRWTPDIPVAAHEGTFNLGKTEIGAVVLPNGVRLLTQATFLRALGRSRSPKAGTGVLNTVDGVPFFLQAEALKPFIDEDLLGSTTPVFYRTKSGKRGVGYDANLLPRVAEVYLKMRDAALEDGRPVPAQHAHIIRASDVLIRGLAGVGIAALVDEATGYQEVRDRRALQAILDKFLRAEQAKWAKRFPDEFYQEIFRLNGWKWKGMRVNRPQVVAHYTKDVVYSRIAPDLLNKLEELNPKDQSGRRPVKHFQWLTDEIGLPALTQHLHSTITLMKAVDSWKEFKTLLDRALPRKTRLSDLPLFSQNSSNSDA